MLRRWWKSGALLTYHAVAAPHAAGVVRVAALAPTAAGAEHGASAAVRAGVLVALVGALDDAVAAARAPALAQQAARLAGRAARLVGAVLAVRLAVAHRVRQEALDLRAGSAVVSRVVGRPGESRIHDQ